MSQPVHQRLIALDFGTQKIGLAFGQSITGTAQAIGIVKAKDGIPDWQAMDKHFKEWEPDAVVVGLPLNMDGSESEMSLRAKKFANRVSDRYQLTCHLSDERLSSREAREISGEFGPDAKIDSVAASVILESWFRQN